MNANQLAPEERELLKTCYRANAVGLPLSLESDGGAKFANDPALIDRLVAKRLMYLVRESDDCQGGYCLTTLGDRLAEELDPFTPVSE